MDDLHAPTVASGPTSRGIVNGDEQHLSLKELIAKKETLEAELSALGSVLDSHGVNMNTSLTTFDGFPRSDIDVAQIRTTRARIIRLKNDHKLVMSKLEIAIHEHFAEGKSVDDTAMAEANAFSRTVPQPSTSTESSQRVIEPPFAKVNSVAPNSPAAEAGMLAGDKITRFGTVNWTSHDRLSKVPREVQQSENVGLIASLTTPCLVADGT